MFQSMKGEIECQDVDARLSENAPLAAFGLFVHKSPNDVFLHAAPSRDSQNLIFGGGGTDVRVEPAPGCCYKIDWDGRCVTRIGCFEGIQACPYGLYERSVRWAEIRSGGGR